MDLHFGPEYEAFRDEVRSFLAERWTAAEPEVKTFRREATERGYLYRQFPRRYGGSEQPADAVRGRILHEEFVRAGRTPVRSPVPVSPCSRRRWWSSDARIRKSASSPAPCRVRSAGARDTASPAPAPTSPR